MSFFKGLLPQGLSLARVKGLEPISYGFGDRRVTNYTTHRIFRTVVYMVFGLGIEPKLTGPKPVVLPIALTENV